MADDKLETPRERAQAALTLAREAVNGWACFARTGKELTEIGRIHLAIDALAALAPEPTPQTGADIHRVREVVGAFSEGYRVGYARGESGEAEDKEDAWDRSKASAGLLAALAPEPTPTYWKLVEDPTWRPYCLSCRTMARMVREGDTFKCGGCGLVVGLDMREVLAPEPTMWNFHSQAVEALDRAMAPEPTPDPPPAETGQRLREVLASIADAIEFGVARGAPREGGGQQVGPMADGFACTPSTRKALMKLVAQARAALAPSAAERTEGRETWEPWEPWHPRSTAPTDGRAFRAYGPALVHPDFNPWGQVEACADGDGQFVGAVWNGCQDRWDTVPIEFTHWQQMPISPRDRP